MELGQKRAGFERQGLRVAAASYDSAEVLKTFAERKGITYPLLSDPTSKMIRDFGILNESMPKGTPYYGVPYPGTYIVDAQGVVQRKFFEKDYKERFSAGSMLAATAREGWPEVETRHLKLRYKASDDEVAGGSRVTLLLQVELKPRMHVYAPGVSQDYIPVKWELPAGAWKALDVKWPASRTLRLEAIKETVPVYEGRFSVSRDITFAQQQALLGAGGEARQIRVESVFRYQACDDRECFPPVNVPMTFTFRVAVHDVERAPENLRRK